MASVYSGLSTLYLMSTVTFINKKGFLSSPWSPRCLTLQWRPAWWPSRAASLRSLGERASLCRLLAGLGAQWL